MVASEALRRRPAVRVVSQDERGSALGRVRTTAFVDHGSATLPRPFRILDSYVLAVVHEGSGTYEVPAAPSRRVSSGDVILVVPGQPHWYGPPPGETWSETFVLFDGAVFDGLARAGVLDPRHGVRRLPVGSWERTVRRFVERTRSSAGTPERYRVVLDLAALLVELFATDAGAPTASPSIVRGRELLADDLRAELELDVVALRVGLPYETFRKQFRAEVGVPPGRFREDRRLEAAGALLRVTSMTHAAIAWSLGFADEQHFSKRFSSRVGVSPKKYRQQHGGRE